jgi:predicted lipoprotein with Yx(FWY)xxD motif
LGRILADGQGRSLYLFEKDRHGRSSCSGLCATYWPPLVAGGRTVAVKGAKASLLGSIRRADGHRQVTYAGHPLYLFSGDTGRDQTNGEGLRDFGAGWYVLMPSGKKIDRDQAMPRGGCRIAAGIDPHPTHRVVRASPPSRSSRPNRCARAVVLGRGTSTRRNA